MEEQTTSPRSKTTLVLLLLGLLGLGLLVYLSVDRIVSCRLIAHEANKDTSSAITGPADANPAGLDTEDDGPADANPAGLDTADDGPTDANPAGLDTEDDGPKDANPDGLDTEDDGPKDANPDGLDTEADSLPTGILVGQRAPDFRLSKLDGTPTALSDFRGSVVILDFWASWCGPCRSTMPSLMRIVRALEPDVVLLGVSLDRNALHASDYLAANDYSAMITLYSSYAAASAVFIRYGGTGIPYTFVLDRQGVIRFVGHPATLSQQTVEKLL